MGHAQRELERAQRHDGLREHLTVGEEIRLAARAHWFVLVRPFLLAVVVTVLSVLILVKAPARIGSNLPVFLLAAIVLVWVRFGWRVIVRWHDMFVATDKRILKYQGIFVTDVPMMRMSKVTDMRFTRSVCGEIFGYGTIVIESAGQDQAIREVTYLPDPVENYRRLCEVIFGDKHEARGGRRRSKSWRRRLDRLTAGRRGHSANEGWDDPPFDGPPSIALPSPARPRSCHNPRPRLPTQRHQRTGPRPPPKSSSRAKTSRRAAERPRPAPSRTTRRTTPTDPADPAAWSPRPSPRLNARTSRHPDADPGVKSCMKPSQVA